MKKNLIWIIPFIILLAGTGYYFYWKVGHKPFNLTPPTEVKSSAEIKAATYTNTDHEITVSYPESWKTADLGGEKNISTPLTRENIVFIYDGNNLKSQDDVSSAQVSAKVLRFVLEAGEQFNSQNDWYAYVKKKVDDYVNTLAAINDYTAISLTKITVNGKWAVEEKYYEPSSFQARDLYILNQDKGEFYQIITSAPKDLYNKFLPYFNLITSSFKIGQ